MDIPSVLQEFHGGRSFRSSVLHGLLWTYRSTLGIAVKDTWETIPLLLRKERVEIWLVYCVSFFLKLDHSPTTSSQYEGLLQQSRDVIPQSLVMVVVVVSMGGQCDPLNLPRLRLWSHTSLWFPSRKRLSAEPDAMWSFGQHLDERCYCFATANLKDGYQMLKL